MSLSAPVVVKWIRVDVADPTVFDRAQRNWHHLTGLSDFGGQSGGWSVAAPRRAVVVGLWADRAAHDDFLATAHDQLAAPQRGSYAGIEVDLLDVEASTESVPSRTAGGVLRTAACRLRPGRLEHALAVQREVWFPAMRAAGMGRSVVARGALSGDDRCGSVVVMSWWPARTAHDRYQRRCVPGLREEADVTEDFSAVEGDLVELVPDWSVAAL